MTSLAPAALFTLGARFSPACNPQPGAGAQACPGTKWPASGRPHQKNGAHPKAAPREISSMQVSENIAHAQHAATFIREGFVKLTPAKMGVVLRECRYDRQRQVDDKHVATLAEYMRRGLWRDKDQLSFARFDGRLTLVNGYHRANAQLASGKDILWAIVIYECDTVDQVRALYHRFDTNLRKRSDQSILKGVGFAEEVGLAPGAATSLYRAVPIIADGMVVRVNKTGTDVFSRRIVDDRLALAKEYAPAAAAFEAMVKPATPRLRKKLGNATTYAVALVTTKLQPDTAQEFWGGMAENDGLRRYDPRAVLFADMMGRNFHTGTISQGLVVPALAWNAFWERRDLKIIKVVGGRKVRILGTPYTVSA